MAAFAPDDRVQAARERLRRWTNLLSRPDGLTFKETELLPEWLIDVFQGLLGYRGPADAGPGRPVTFSREKHVAVDGKYADAVLGVLEVGREKVVVALEGKGPLDPLDRPFAGRKMSAVDQAYRYAINIPCDWILVTNMREIRLYSKLRDQRTYERWLLQELVEDEQELARFVSVLSPDRVIDEAGGSPLNALLEASERAGEQVTQAYYAEYAKVRRDVLGALLEANPTVAPDAVLSATQRLLDRILFVAFAEDRGLVPTDLLASAYKHRDPFNPRPIWQNFLGVFRAVDLGSEVLRVPRYNGGLFAHHELLDAELAVPDAVCQRLKRLGDFNYGAPDQSAGPVVDVDILGHIFEQSIEDLESIRAELQGGHTDRKTSKRKREGAFYTPAFLTSYIVHEALEPVLAERFETLRQKHHSAASGTARRVLVEPGTYNLFELNQPQRDALIRFWEAWLAELATVRILDPACGSGAFLVEAFDQLHARYVDAVDRLVDLRGERSLFDPDRTILQDNLYGVDVNEEAVEIARLSIWIKTAERGKVLADLNRNIRVGNSVVSDPTVDARAFSWQQAFPEVFAQGGFDVVLGNPPYVRGEMLTAIKPYLEEHYGAYHGQADLYVYFYELGLRLLRPGGRLSYVVTNKWMKAGYAEPLRRLFSESGWVESVVDFGHAKKIFPDADVMPGVILVRKPVSGAPPHDARVCVIPRDELQISNLQDQLERSGFTIARERLGAGPWTLERPGLDALFQKMQAAGSTTGALGLVPKYGIKTGLNEAYLITSAERDALVSADTACRALIHPCMRGQDAARWAPRMADLWMIVLKSSGDHRWPWSGLEEPEAERVFSEAYPTLHRHMKRHETRLRARTDRGAFWWELRSCDYYAQFHAPKVIYADITWRAQFAFAPSTLFFVNTVYMFPTDDLFTLGVLNSPLLWSYMWRHAQHGKDEALRLFRSFTEAIPVPRCDEDVRQSIAERVNYLVRLAASQHAGRRQMLDWLATEFGVTKPGLKLGDPAGLRVDAFIDEVRGRRAGKKNLSSGDILRLKSEYETVLVPLQSAAAKALQLEKEVSDLVNAAFGLSPSEVALLWETAPPRMPLSNSTEVDA